ncbi:hypothetical protein Agub_g11853 [Astrephomene gubernaculifera]|uniref:Uncharacterized protein n=1 Tax=Astrephomene gubernaculifera TaxID=47775 RepID=A0AAD3HR21_9CHLO|nr:hypothetical protein Agub_g11853 [Astrephomene gubernaculifera]
MAEELERLRDTINQHLRRADYEGAGVVIAKAVPLLLQFSVDEWMDVADDVACDTPGEAAAMPSDTANASAQEPKSNSGGQEDPQKEVDGDSDSSGSSSSSDEDGDADADDDNEDGDEHLITSYRYRSTLHHPRNPRLEHLCTWLYDTVVHPSTGEEPEEQACQKLPAAILAAWRRLQQQQQQKLLQNQQQQQDQKDPQPSEPQTGNPEQQQEPGKALEGSAAASEEPVPPPLPPTEALHLQHSAFSAPFCTWRHVAPDTLPPLHDVLVGVLRVCWERHEDREPSRNIIWGAQSHSRRDDPVTAYLYVEYLRLLLAAIVRSRAEPLWLWHELQEVIEEYPHWRHHPHEVAVLARMMVEHGCGWRLLNSLLEHVGKAPLLMYGTWAALWDALRRPEARACARLATQHGVAADAVWAHVAELTLLQVKEHPRDSRLLARAVAVLSRVLHMTPAPEELAASLRVERDAPAACEGVRAVTSQLRLGD